MCRGTFDGPNEQPRITASLLHVSFQIGHELSLIIDTGADSTTLSGIDAVKMGLVPEQLDEMEMEYSEIDVSGVSSTTGYAIKEPFVLATEEHSTDLDRYSLHIELLNELIVVPTLSDSLLGRDILNRFNISYEFGMDEITFERRNFGKGLYISISGEEEMTDQLHDVVEPFENNENNDKGESS